MKICPRCEAGYPDELTTCPVHGGLLSEIRDLKPGMLVRNTYRIRRKLSRGGMGNVYLAQHILLDEPQVLKFLSRDLCRDQEWTGRFLREVRTLRQIRHKNVIAAGNVEPAEDGTLFFSMEYVDGPDLMEFYRRAPKPFDVALALTIVRGAAEGLGAAHAVGVVHRDIKPENILMAREGDMVVPKIADFGIVATQDVTRITQSGTTFLTPQFAAPEQWTGTPTPQLDGRTDFYALGGMLFELLTGRSAFQAANNQEWALQHLNASPPPPSQFRPELLHWRGLDQFVLRLLAKKPEDRPHDIRELLRVLTWIEYVAPVRDLLPAAELSQADFSPPVEELQATDLFPIAAEAVELVPVAAQAAELVPARATTRARTRIQPMPIWEPMQPRSSMRARVPHDTRTVTAKPARRTSPFTVLAFLAVVLAIAFGIDSMMVSPVRSRVLSNQHDAIVAVAFSPDGLNVASASRDHSVQFWNVRDARALGSLAATTNALAYSPAGDAIATAMADDTIDIWDASRGVVLVTLQGHTAQVSALAFSPDGRTLASGSWDQTVRLWDVASGRLLRTLTGSTGRIFSLAFSPDGRRLASAGADQTIRFWDPETGTALRTLQGHTRAIHSIAFSPNGQILASAGDDQTIRLWNASTGQVTRVLQNRTGAVLSVAFSPDGRTLASGDAGARVELWDVPSGRLLRTLKGQAGPVLSVAFSPFSGILATGSSDKTIRLWNVANVRE